MRAAPHLLDLALYAYPVVSREVKGDGNHCFSTHSTAYLAEASLPNGGEGAMSETISVEYVAIGHSQSAARRDSVVI